VIGRTARGESTVQRLLLTDDPGDGKAKKEKTKEEERGEAMKERDRPGGFNQISLGAPRREKKYKGRKLQNAQCTWGSRKRRDFAKGGGGIRALGP